jgi:hypothetical protein
MDEAGHFNLDIIPKFFELGLMGIEVPETLGGAGANIFLAAIAIEELARVDASAAMFLRTRVSGPSVDVLVVSRSVGDVWRKGLEMGQPLAPPPSPPISAWVLTPGNERQDTIRVGPGQYYVVIENGNRVGTVNPPWSPLGVIGGNVAVVSYLAELGDVD